MTDIKQVLEGRPTPWVYQEESDTYTHIIRDARGNQPIDWPAGRLLPTPLLGLTSPTERDGAARDGLPRHILSQ